MIRRVQALLRSSRGALFVFLSTAIFLRRAALARDERLATTGEEVEALTRDVMSQPKEVIDRLKVMMGN